MNKQAMHAWAQTIAQKKHIKNPELLYEGNYYTNESIRAVIYKGELSGTPVALKVYDDPRITDEPISLKSFHHHNTSRLITAPTLYDYQLVSSHRGWFIMEYLPAGGSFFTTPLDPKDREKFLTIYLEYRRNFPSQPTRQLLLMERLPAHEFHVFRINRWLELAQKAEAKRSDAGQPVLLLPTDFLPRYLESIKIIRHEFCQRNMIWCHGHFKPQEIYQTKTKPLYYLTDFAHTHLYPEGYELAFIIWADHFMTALWNVDFNTWKQPVYDWIEALRPIAVKLNLARFDELMRASLIERILGTILADIIARDLIPNEAAGRIKLLYSLLDELLATVEK